MPSKFSENAFIKEADLAYTAGLIDGEGTIGFSKRKNAKYRRPVLSIASTSIELVQYLKELYGGTIISKKTYKPHHKNSYAWNLVDTKALDLLTAILPYLREPEKKRRAMLLATQYPLVVRRNGKYTPEQHQARLLLEYNFFDPSIPSKMHKYIKLGTYESLAGLQVSPSPDGVSIDFTP